MRPPLAGRRAAARRLAEQVRRRLQPVERLLPIALPGFEAGSTTPDDEGPAALAPKRDYDDPPAVATKPAAVAPADDPAARRSASAAAAPADDPAARRSASAAADDAAARRSAATTDDDAAARIDAARARLRSEIEPPEDSDEPADSDEREDSDD